MKYGLEFAGAKRVRRDWRGTVVTVLTLLALSALCGWLWSCVRGAGAGRGAWGMGQGMMPVAEAGHGAWGMEHGMMPVAEAGRGAWGVEQGMMPVAMVPAGDADEGVRAAMLCAMAVPEWVAFGIVAMAVLALMVRLAWDVMVERAEADPFEDDGRWQEQQEREGDDVLRLREFLAKKGIEEVPPEEIAVLVELARGGSLVAVDKYVRAQWKKRLFVTSLMELLALCARVKSTEVVS